MSVGTATPPPPSLLCFTSDCPFCPSGSTRTARATGAPSEYLPWWWHGIALLAAVMLAGLGGCSLGAHCVSLLAAGPLAARTTCKCLWGWGTPPQLGSVHPQMGGSGLSPSPSLNVSPLCKGLPGQVGLPGEIGVPGPKVRGQDGVLPAPASACHRLLGSTGETPPCVWASLQQGGLCYCSRVPSCRPPSHGWGMPPFPGLPCASLPLFVPALAAPKSPLFGVVFS